MSTYKTFGIGAGVVVVMAGASVGGYMLLQDGADTSESTEASASASADPKESAPMASIAGVVPDDVDFYVEVPSVRALAQGTSKMKIVDVGLLDLLASLDQIGAGVGKAFDLDAKDGSALVSSFKSVALAGRIDVGPENDKKEFYGGALASDKPALVKKLLASKRFSKDGKVGDFDKYKLAARESGDAGDDTYTKVASAVGTPPGLSIVWLADKGLLLLGNDAFLEGLVAVAGGKGKALSESASYQKDLEGLDDKPRVFAYVPASILKRIPTGSDTFVDDFMKDPGPFLMGVYLDPAGINIVMHGGVGGNKVPVIAVPAPPKLDIGGKLPKETLGYIAYSTKLDMSGAEAERRLVDLVKTFDLSAAADIQKSLDEARTALGLGLTELVDALGEQAVIGAIAKDEEFGFQDFENIDINENFAVVSLQALKDQASMKKIVDAVQAKAPIAKTHSLSATDDGGFEATPKTSGDAPFFSVRYPKGDLFIGVGPEALVKKAYESIEAGSDTLAADKAHGLSVGGVGGKPHVLNWFDVSRALRKPMPGMDEELFGPFADVQKKIVLRGDNRVTMTTSFGLESKGESYRYRLDMLNSLGALPAVAIYGVRRYLSSSKGSEAKNTLGAISRGAAAAFERESAGAGAAHKLCKSANPVPTVVPSGNKYQPNTAAGSDFETGDEETGWRCLKFSMTQPHYFQYGYTAGGPYKGPAVGGPDPGPNGFEAWAVGDLDGDGVTSLFTITGTVDPATGTLKRSTEIFIHNEHE